ncbi:MAG: UDP-N-acetylglucosamine 2-epimerase (non-hydrolyzing) [Chloroflexi bacterium]|nr:MAG: UDP-N-acetylglucosamine 2-epimerase (non-hydrolyzing) [Chloroflexota bacterium]
MRFLTVLGARPQFIKAAPLTSVLRRHHEEVLVHTGQHYDYGMSEVFFAELGIPAPDHHLGVGSGSHGAQTGAMLERLEGVMLEAQPDVVLVYGDTNSTLAGALTAAKLQIPVAHVEAGLRSFNRTMAEEVNRVITDHLSTWLFAPSAHAERQLRAEGIETGVHVVGDIMYDALRLHAERARQISKYPETVGLRPGDYYLCTVHRAENTDAPERLEAILCGLSRLDKHVVLPMHPRTRKRLAERGLAPGVNVRVCEPVGYLDMLQLVSASAAVLTDSGGLQKEAYYLEVPCVTLREETEWVETVQVGWNTLAGTDPDAMVAAIARFRVDRPPHPPLYGSGDTAGRIARVFESGSSTDALQ